MKPPFAILAVCLLGWLLPLSAADRVALVIGVDSYDHLPEQSQLHVAVKDAERMANTLKGLDPPFDVTLLTDVKQRSAEDALEAFIDGAKGAECVLIYFAGHGVEYHGENFLLVKDTNVDSPSTDVERMKRRLANDALSLQAIVDELDSTGAQVKVVVLDACRDNPLRIQSPEGSRSVFGGSRGLAQVTPPSGSLIAYSADAGQKANDGLYTEELTRHMKEPGLSLPDVFALTRETVKSESLKLAQSNRGVFHEPAEYTKLNLAGNRFTLVRGETKNKAVSEEQAKKMAEMEKQIASMKKIIESLEQAGTENEALKEQLAKMENALVEEKSDKAEDSETMAVTQPQVTPAFPATRGMEGSQAGETRTFGGIEFVWCPPTGGEGFLMGSPESEEDRDDDESQHRVILTEGFWMAKTECTQGQWERVMGNNPSEFAGSKNLPVETVSWDDVHEWLAKMNETHPLPEGWAWGLPTEAQWEYACRAGTETAYSFGEDGSQLHRYGNFADKNVSFDWADKSQDDGVGEITTEVGSYEANKWGLLDMHGNVFEWCADWLVSYAAGVVTDPLGAATSGSYLVNRGGSWRFNGLSCRSADRSRGYPRLRANYLGFRPAVRFVGNGDGEKTEGARKEQTMAISKPEETAFPATRGMEGNKAGETRTFGGIEFVWCPPTGEEGFLMGSPEDEEGRGDDEMQHRVILTKGYWMAKTECTQGQWESVMGSNPSNLKGRRKKSLPVEQVSWIDVQGWLEKMSEAHPLPEGWKWTLPTEAQWEYACRAGTTGSYAGLLDEMAWYGEKWKWINEVGQKKANDWGFQDMHGNVSEWCVDWKREYTAGVATDPKGATSGSYRVHRGGGWFSDGTYCRSASRNASKPIARSDKMGFRPTISFDW